MIGVDHDLLTAQNLLLATVHEVVLVHTIFLPLRGVLLTTGAAREHCARIKVTIGVTL